MLIAVGCANLFSLKEILLYKIQSRSINMITNIILQANVNVDAPTAIGDVKSVKILFNIYMAVEKSSILKNIQANVTSINTIAQAGIRKKEFIL